MDVRRYCGIEELKINLEFVTPAFIGSADGKNAELRASSFKGMIRFWWRVLYGAQYGNGILEKENEIFGSANSKNTSASNVRIVIENSKITTSNANFKEVKDAFSYHTNGNKIPINIIDYLAYGKFEYIKGKGNVYNSSYIVPKSSFTLSISCNKNYTEEVFTALYALVEFGGIGARCRNGFGSMRLLGESRKKLNEKKQEIVRNMNICEFSSFSKKSKFYRTKRNDYANWEEALSDTGIIYKDARKSLEENHEFENRGLVARPIEVKQKKNEKPIPSYIKKGRLPKFVFMHITINGGGKYEGRILTLPIQYYEKHDENSDYMKIVDKINSEFEKNMTDITERISGGKK